MKYSREPSAGEKVLLNHTLGHNTSYQALTFLGEDLELEVLCSSQGWYLGCKDVDGDPLARDSGYFKSEAAAREALDSHSWTQKLAPTRHPACLGTSITGLIRHRGEASFYGIGIPLAACLFVASCL
jgi:hypothetical protein